MNEKPKIFKAVLLALLQFFLYWLFYLIIVTVITLIFSLMLHIPVLGRVAAWLVSTREGTPHGFIVYFSVGISTYLVHLISRKVCKLETTAHLSHTIAGIAIILVGIVALLDSWFISRDSTVTSNITTLSHIIGGFLLKSDKFNSD